MNKVFNLTLDRYNRGAMMVVFDVFRQPGVVVAGLADREPGAGA